MFERYIKTKDFLPLPLSGNLYRVSVDGRVKDINNQEIPQYLDMNGIRVVQLQWVDGYTEYSIAKLVAYAFKPLHLPFKHWSLISVLHKDGDSGNIHPNNLVWKFPVNGIESKQYPGYCYIPCYTQYVIDRKGEVIKSLTGEKMAYFINKKGYYIYSLIPDIGKRHSPGRYRLLCLTYTDYPVDVDELHVNHIDEDTGNDDLDNLEWVTPKRNNHHSLKLKRYRLNERIDIRNVLTGEVRECISLEEDSKLLGLSNASLCRYLKSGF